MTSICRDVRGVPWSSVTPGPAGSHAQPGPQPQGLAPFTWNGLDGGERAGGSLRFSAGTSRPENVPRKHCGAPRSTESCSPSLPCELRGIGELPFTAVREIRNEATTEVAGTTDAPVETDAEDTTHSLN